MSNQVVIPFPQRPRRNAAPSVSAARLRRAKILSRLSTARGVVRGGHRYALVHGRRARQASAASGFDAPRHQVNTRLLAVALRS